jgi:ABC-type multidrug transport system ATPase subunit
MSASDTARHLPSMMTSSHTVAAGQVTAFLGPNGLEKSTTLIAPTHLTISDRE